MANIIHFGKYYSPDLGGIEFVTESLAKGAVLEGHNVTVVCFSKFARPIVELKDGVKVFMEPIAAVLASQPLGLGYFFRCYITAKSADIIHLHAPNMLAALCALFIPKKTKLLVHWHSDVVSKQLFSHLLRPLEFALLCRADLIIATSQNYSNASDSLSLFQSKVSVIPIGVSDPVNRVDKSPFLPALDFQFDDKNIILSVGRLVSYKGFDVLIKAAKYFDKDVMVIIVGCGPLRESLQKLIDINGVGDRVILAGQLSDSKLHILFNRSRLFCLPSVNRAEAFGVVLLEGMAHGLPIIASDIPGSGVSWVNEHGISGLNAPPNDYIALAKICKQVLKSTELHARLSQGARQRFLAEFTDTLAINRTMRAYKRLIG